VVLREPERARAVDRGSAAPSCARLSPCPFQYHPVTRRVLADQIDLERTMPQRVRGFVAMRSRGFDRILPADGGDGGRRRSSGDPCHAEVGEVAGGEAEAGGVILEVADAGAVLAFDGQAVF